ncbi:MAG: PQQ-dependent sugar dehydrogenase [Actinomycetota bacterium]
MRPSRTLATALVVFVLVSAAGPAAALPRGMRVKTYKSDLSFAVDMAWVPGTKKIFFTEKDTGKVRVLIGRSLRKRACVNLDVNANGYRGALGIVLHPNYKRNHYLYVYYTNASPLENRVTRFTVRSNRCRDRKHIVTGIEASSDGHLGGQLEFAGGKLFVSVGDQGSPSNSQDTSNRLGKILRYNPNGGVPSDNPFTGSLDDTSVWAYGLRNPFGLTKKPGTKKLFATDNGPDCDDELNRIRKGRNYGWGPGYECGTAGVGDDPESPLLRWSGIIAPTDPWWYKGRLKRLSGDIYVGDFSAGRLHRIVINAKGTRVRRDRVIFKGNDGILDVAKGPGRWLYFLTQSAIRRVVPDTARGSWL